MLVNHKGKIISLTMDIFTPAAEYICTAHYGDIIEWVPLHPKQAGHLEFPPTPLSSILFRGRRDDKALIEKTTAEYKAAVKSWERGDRDEDFMNVLVGKSSLESIRNNLKRIESLNDYSAGKNDVFAKIYGDPTFNVVGVVQDEVMLEPGCDGSCCKCAIGKVAFVEFGELFGDFIVVEQSDEFVYGVWAASVASGYTIVRIPIDEINILHIREDASFIGQFAERLDDMTTEDYSAIQCDAAETVVATLRRFVQPQCCIDCETSPLPAIFGDNGVIEFTMNYDNAKVSPELFRGR